MPPFDDSSGRNRFASLAKAFQNAGMQPQNQNPLIADPTNPAYYMVPRSPQQTSAANFAYAKPSQSGYLTQLNPQEEAQFQQWTKQNNVPFDPSPNADYDMRGFYKGLMSGDPHAETGVNQNDNQLHFSDWWKTPNHMSFSRESQWATPSAPTWNDLDQLVSPNGTVVFDEKALAKSRQGQ